MAIDPTQVQLSDSFLLSDFMGCDSVYRYGYPNQFKGDQTTHIKEGRLLADTLEHLQEQLGFCKVCYGYISPSLSRRIVKYQDPNKPSYHRWEIGAAADICFPLALARGMSPVQIASVIDNLVPYSRMITYSESEWICLATSTAEMEKNKPRRAFYENRFVPGQKKPIFVRYSENPAVRERQKADIPDDTEGVWIGQGWPRYHGGGRLQLEHQRMRQFGHYIDFLYDKVLVNRGVQNLPPLTHTSKMTVWRRNAALAADILDMLQEGYGRHFSVISAFNKNDPMKNWRNHMTLEVAIPTGEDVYAIADELDREFPMLQIQYRTDTPRHQLKLTGEDMS